MAIVFTEKCCSHCGKINWDSDSKGYGEYCDKPERAGMKCDINGEVRNWDEKNNRV